MNNSVLSLSHPVLLGGEKKSISLHLITLTLQWGMTSRIRERERERNRGKIVVFFGAVSHE